MVVLHQGAYVDVGEHVPADHHYGPAELALQKLHGAGRSGGAILEREPKVDAELPAAAQRIHHVLGAVAAGEVGGPHVGVDQGAYHILQARSSQDRQQRLGPGAGERPEACPLTAREDDGGHLVIHADTASGMDREGKASLRTRMANDSS